MQNAHRRPASARKIRTAAWSLGGCRADTLRHQALSQAVTDVRQREWLSDVGRVKRDGNATRLFLPLSTYSNRVTCSRYREVRESADQKKRAPQSQFMDRHVRHPLATCE